MRYCQGTMCHEYRTKDRIRGQKGAKHYETRKGILYHGEFCSMRCQDDWLTKFAARAIDHFGSTHEPKRTDASGAWYKDYLWNRNPNGRVNNGMSNGDYTHYFVNDLLGQRIPITEQQYDDENFTTPN